MLHVYDSPAELVETQRRNGLALFIHDDELDAMISNLPAFRLSPSHQRATDGLTITPNRDGITIGAMGRAATFVEGEGYMGRAHVNVHDGFFIVAMPHHTLVGIVRHATPASPATMVEYMALQAWWEVMGIESNTRMRVSKLLNKLIAIYESPVTVRESTMRS